MRAVDSTLGPAARGGFGSAAETSRRRFLRLSKRPRARRRRLAAVWRTCSSRSRRWPRTLGCPVLVEDPQHRPLWWSAQGEIDGVRSRTILQREPPPEAAALVTKLGLADARRPRPHAGAARRRHVRALVRAAARRAANCSATSGSATPRGESGADDLAPVLACAELAARTLGRSPAEPGGARTATGSTAHPARRRARPVQCRRTHRPRAACRERDGRGRRTRSRPEAGPCPTA